MTRREIKFNRRGVGLTRASCVVLALMIGAFAFGAQKKRPPDQPLDLNLASAEELQELPGVGPSMAKAIVDFREKSGPFQRVEELLAIRGITKERLEKIRPYVKIVPRESNRK